MKKDNDKPIAEPETNDDVNSEHGANDKPRSEHDRKVDEAAKRILKKHRRAFEELAK